ncbi:SDR family NAD(P)-dependent oxidoreductase [Sporobolomyces salmoneus]|uniref:SDR family NAD(P)-dependent oxidoreductase n=1 Tax=Sporobolomyces salmoneus TaxID=183962 RepID=UPI0031812A72
MSGAPSKFSLSGKVAIVTGAASGIGLAIVKAFLEADIAGITLVDLSWSSFRTARSQLSTFFPSKILFLPLDCSLASSAEVYVQSTIEKFGKLDISVQCAGICPEGKGILETSEEEFDRVMAINVKGVWLGCKESFRGMMQDVVAEERAETEGKVKRVRGDKNMLVISSQIGLDGMANLSPYSASKFALRGITASLSQEFGPHGVRVNSLNPGPTKTPLYVESFPKKAAHEARASLGRAGETEEIAASAVYLCSEAAGYTTGTTLKVDGGWSKWC